MYAVVIPVSFLSFLVYYFVISPVWLYLRDPKGFRKYPAMNALAGITDLGFMYEATKGFRTKRLTELHKKYPVVRIGPNSLSFSGVQAIKDIYGHGTPCTKDHFYVVTGGSHTHLADVVNKADHARKRRVLSSAYAIKNLEDWEYKVADKTERFIKACDAACTLPPKTSADPQLDELTFDYRKWTNFFTVEAIADIGLSEKLGFLDNGSADCTAEKRDGTLYTANFVESLHNTAIAQSRLVWGYSWYKTNEYLARLLSKDFRRMLRLGDQFDDIVYHRATKRLARYRAGEKLDDFFQALMEDKNGRQNNQEWGEIVAEVSIMMNAGSDTTAIAMNNAMYHLLKHPDALKKLQEEVDSALDEDEEVAPFAKVKHLPYLRAVIDETLRITPSVTFNLPRRTPQGGCAIGDEFIPGETSVSISAWTAHRDEEVFPEPEEFRPERWLGEGAQELQRGFIAFSTGARGCIGRNISYLEQTVLLASVVHRYGMALPSKEWTPELDEGTNLLVKEMPVKVWRRRI
ncbi:hypothetical protein NCS57_00316200 [Fusarium keratoplasticum]|uniref:Uncharacterized protein n=1 Tax=Fusarium keratoplasticum TaxID=1328300 RepID=A0ACC0RAC5_9HYPO|nr:hypothetical protein NCS57_00316200 [Fusarium keratoplasticum]KAI8680357.1 hypothetical protein NCS57_00316200 [Fusarium keratoplasticum]KAI8686427.1 hypothetical protein NCS55_00318400 [Fusarium keratoplasticum]